MKYCRVTFKHRLCIKTMQASGLTNGEISDKLGFHRCTIGREIKRNSGGRGYRCKQAQKLCEQRQCYRYQARRMLPPMIEAVEKKLKLKWSPEQIRNRFKKAGHPYVSAETIYKYIKKDRAAGGHLWTHLRYSHKRRRRRFPAMERRGRIHGATSIEKRPNGAKNRSRLGHWERDSMLGSSRKGGILVLTERKSRFNRLQQVDVRTARKITKATITATKGYKFKSITNDRGLEFYEHERLTKKTGIPVYFCDPYSSYQRGTNENRIGVLRQYIPKGSDLRCLNDAKLQYIENEINNRPMKCLDWRTPYEVLLNKRCATSW
jgi:transposase, IS30 family